MSFSPADTKIENRIIPAAERVAKYFPRIEHQAIGLVGNQASRVGEVHLLDTLLTLGADVKKIFVPEHGFRGEADAGAQILDGRDPATGIPIISLYGQKRKPDPEDMEGLDVILFDLQDVGVRFYTYISTLHYVMEACAEHDIALVVLDRPNPNGFYVDGPVLDPDYQSFVGMHPVPVVYGLTIGELAMMINGEGWLGDAIRCDLTVIPCLHYDHTMSYDIPVKPSPNLPNQRAVLLYPSLCFFEPTTVSIGRGTEHQFQVIGHPEAHFGSYAFTPEPKPGAMHPKHEGVRVYGTGLTGLKIEDIMQWRALNLQWLLSYYSALGEQEAFFTNPGFFDKLAGSDQLRLLIQSGAGETAIRASWAEDLRTFMRKRKKYLLYPDFE